MASSSAAPMSQVNGGSSPRRAGAAVRGGGRDDEAEEDADAEGGAPVKRRVKEGTRIARDQGNVPAVRDDTGEEVMRLFEAFLEK